MSLDPFEARLQFLKLVRTLNASQQSIQKVVSFAVKYGAKCGEDLWECVGDEIGKVSRPRRALLQPEYL
jgi:CTD kinase subunit gamma